MESKEKIKVYILFDENKKTVCICHRGRKKCKRNCIPEIVERDRFRGIKQLCRVDRYGKTRDIDD